MTCTRPAGSNTHYNSKDNEKQKAALAHIFLAAGLNVTTAATAALGRFCACQAGQPLGYKCSLKLLAVEEWWTHRKL